MDEWSTHPMAYITRAHAGRFPPRASDSPHHKVLSNHQNPLVERLALLGELLTVFFTVLVREALHNVEWAAQHIV